MKLIVFQKRGYKYNTCCRVQFVFGYTPEDGNFVVETCVECDKYWLVVRKQSRS